MGDTLKDLTGQTFQYLTVLERADNIVFKNNKIKVRWLCECVCGKQVVKYSRALKVIDKPVSCGCMTPKKPLKYDLTGQQFGFLTVTSRSAVKNDNRNYFWSCQCECGQEVLVLTHNLMNNEKKSCGCKTKAETSGTHGMHRSPTWISWSSMKQRCTKEYHKSYPYYKDVPIVDEWLDSFESFLRDMGERPEGMTLDRVDNSLGYCKENCRWATDSEQQQNRTPNYINKHKGLAGVGASGSKFQSRIRYKGVTEYLGTFETPEEANDAYNKRGFELLGDAWVYKGAPE